MLWNGITKWKLIVVRTVVSAALLLVSFVSEARGEEPEDSLVSWWSMEGTVEDIISDNEPSETGGLSFVDGKVGQGVTFGLPPDEDAGYVWIPDSDSLRLQRFTLEAWVQPAGPGGDPQDSWGSVIFNKRVTGNEASFGLTWRSLDGRFVYLFGPIQSHIIPSQNTFPPLPSGEFYHVAGTYDGQTFKLFVNGQLEGSMVVVKTIDYNSNPWMLGTGYWPGWRTFDGIIDELRIYNRALTPEEIQARASDPVDLLLDLIADVVALNIQQGIENSLDAKLDSALAALDDINENNDVAAINALGAFINAVQAQSGVHIPVDDANALIAAAQQIIDLLSS